jgi:sec-independent protein translocase protein TatB
MLDLSWAEILVIAIVLIVVVGPKDLPKMLRSFGRTTSGLRRMAGDFRKQFDDALKEAELDELKTLAQDARKLDPRNELKKAFSPMEKAAQDVRAGLDVAMKPSSGAKPDVSDEPASPESRPAEPVKVAATADPGAVEAAPTVAKSVAAKSASPVSATSTSAPAAGKAPASPAKKPAARKAAVADKPSAKPTKKSASAKPTASKDVKAS